MTKRKRWLALLLALALGAALAACGERPAPNPSPDPSAVPSAQPAPEAAEFALACYPDSGFHPITGSNRTNLALAGLVYEGLFALDQQFQPQPVLCTSYTVSEDGLSWSFQLRSGVRFSDGSPLTAAEVVSSLELARTSSLYSARFRDVGSITAGELSVTVTLTQPNGGLPALLDIPIVKETGSIPLGTGPYNITGSGDTLALTARSDWWQGSALPLEEIPLRSIREADDLIHAFDTKDIALVSTDLTGSNALGFSGSFDTVDYPTSVMVYVGFNTRSGLCRDAGLRQALLRAFDRVSIVNSAFSRHAQAAALPISPASALYQEDLDEALEFSSQALEELLTQAGWTRSGESWGKGHQSLSLTLVAPSDNSHMASAASTLADGLTQAGISVDLQLLAWDDYSKALESGSFDLYLAQTRLTADFDLTSLITAGGSLNYGGYQDAEAATLLRDYLAATGQGRDLSARRLYQRLAEEPPFAVLCFKNWSVLTQWSRITGMTPTQQNVFYNFSQWNIT